MIASTAQDADVQRFFYERQDELYAMTTFYAVRAAIFLFSFPLLAYVLTSTKSNRNTKVVAIAVGVAAFVCVAAFSVTYSVFPQILSLPFSLFPAILLILLYKKSENPARRAWGIKYACPQRTARLACGAITLIPLGICIFLYSNIIARMLILLLWIGANVAVYFVTKSRQEDETVKQEISTDES